MTDSVEQLLDTRGLLCPEPLMLLRNAVRDLAPGARLRILATDPSTERDFRNFCRFMGHELEQVDAPGADAGAAGEWRFLLRKGSG